MKEKKRKWKEVRKIKIVWFQFTSAEFQFTLPDSNLHWLNPNLQGSNSNLHWLNPIYKVEIPIYIGWIQFTSVEFQFARLTFPIYIGGIPIGWDSNLHRLNPNLQGCAFNLHRFSNLQGWDPNLHRLNPNLQGWDPNLHAIGLNPNLQGWDSNLHWLNHNLQGWDSNLHQLNPIYISGIWQCKLVSVLVNWNSGM